MSQPDTQRAASLAAFVFYHGTIASNCGYPSVAVDTSSVVSVDPGVALATFRVRYAGDARMPGAPQVPPHREMRMLAEVRCADSTFHGLPHAH